jgi:putative transposase
VRKTATVSLEGNDYSGRPVPGRPEGRAGLRPFRHDRDRRYWQGRKAGWAVPQVIGRHTHPKAPPDEDPEPAALTGIDYLSIVGDGDDAGVSGDQLRLSALDDSQDPPGGNGEDGGREEER